MRLEGQLKGGFYPIPPQAMASLLKYVALPETGRVYVIDPCCGDGDALFQIGEHFGFDSKQLFGCELEPTRHETACLKMPNSWIIGPANFLMCDATSHSFSLAWVNPPFDDEIGGGERVEHTFLKHVTPMICNGGILMFACPAKVAENQDVHNHFKAYYEDYFVVPYPEEHRHFNEVVIFGRKRPSMNTNYYWGRWSPCEPRILDIPPGHRPFRFEKVELSDEEIEALVALSPLTRLIESSVQPPLPSPPLALGKGHIALLLASGHLNGVVRADNEPPHVVRGTARKTEYTSAVAHEVDPEKMTEKTTVVRSEKIQLTIRAVDSTGTIKTFAERVEDVADPKSDPNTTEVQSRKSPAA